MDYNSDNLKRLIENLKTINFWGRLFKWRKIKANLIDAAVDLQKLNSIIENQKDNLIKLESDLISANKDLKIAFAEISKKESEIEKMKLESQSNLSEIEKLKIDYSTATATIKSNDEKFSNLTSENRILVEKNTYLQTENKKISEVNVINIESLSTLGNRKSELEIEIAELKKDLQKSDSDFQEATNKIKNLTGNLSSEESTNKANQVRLNSLTNENNLLSQKNATLLSENKKLAEETATNSEVILNQSKRQSELEIEVTELKKEIHYTSSELNETKKLNTQLQKDEEFRKKEHSNSLSALSTIQNQIQTERAKEIEDKNNLEIERLKNLKETWNRHEDGVNHIIKGLCQRHTIEYVNKVPFKGDPDNTLLICGEYVIFDAKSPGGENLGNFPTYLKDQAERAKKYAKQENVKTDIFFIVPSNTLDYLSTFVYKLGDYNVYIISIDALEPIILSLKKIEEYEFVEQLSPEDRDNICRVLGQFAHLSKRRIQVDSFFARQFIELAYKCESDLPPEILKTVMEFEKVGKLNPPLEKRAKSIPISEIEIESKKIKHEADGRGIVIQDEIISELLNELPLYKKVDE